MKRFFFSLILVAFTLCLSAQTVNLPRSLRSGSNSQSNAKTERTMKFFVGGNMNSNFGYNLALAPEIGIQPAKWLRIGAGPRYELQVLTNGNYDRFTTHAVGASVFAEGVIVNRILLHVGYEYLNYPTNVRLVQDPNTRRGYSLQSDRDNLHACALGVGYHQRLSDKLSLYGLYVIYPFMTPNDYYNPLPMFARIGISYEF